MKQMTRLTAMVLVILLLTNTAVSFAESSKKYCLTNAYDGSTVNAGKDTGFSERTSIEDCDDVHFGWSLGSFYMTGFTDVIEEDSVPVFLVNPGDSITLSYELLQDIDKLNGNEDLTIYNDEDGWDAEYQLGKTDVGMGRGMLFVKYTDNMRNTECHMYSDYLTSVQGKTADSTLSFLTEGDYEVALDYEILDDGFLMFNSYSNYRTSCKFKIRNSNCMVFVRDLSTKDELANYAVAEKGFMLDYANSHYLHVSVKREILTNNGHGYSKTVRLCRYACDGAKYTEEGIYTITVKNVYTHESVEMIIAVGENQLANAYVAGNCVYEPDTINQLVAEGKAKITEDWRVEMIEQPQIETPEQPNEPAAFKTELIEIEPVKAAAVFQKNANDSSGFYALAAIIAVVIVLPVIAIICGPKKKRRARKHSHYED